MRSMIIVIIIAGLITFSLVIGKVWYAVRWSKEVKALFSESEDISHDKFNFRQLQNLPEPVQQYFRHVLKEGQPMISFIRLKHTGLFKTGQKNNWVNIKGEQYFTTATPGFIWQGKTSMFSARDSYISGKGRLSVYLFSVLRIVNGTGYKYNHGELLRWVAESVWFPTNLLPGEHLHWTPVDDHSALLHFNYNHLVLNYKVRFNDTGEITTFETGRYMGEENLETWIGSVSNYKYINGVRIPFTIEAMYKLKEGDYSYAKFDVSEIEYNIPEKFKD